MKIRQGALGLLALAAPLVACTPIDRPGLPPGASRLPAAPPTRDSVAPGVDLPYQPYSYGTARPDPWPKPVRPAPLEP